MATITPFTPQQASPPFQFKTTLDGSNYLVRVLWNWYGQRWYVFLYDGAGNRIFTLPLIGSPPPRQIASLANDSSGKVTLVTSVAHGLEEGNVFRLLVSGASPGYFNGRFLFAAQDDVTLTTTLSPAPVAGAATALPPGFVQQAISLTDGYLQTLLRFSPAAQQFSVG